MIYNVLKNFCLITFALIAPITLPAGGIQKSLHQNKFPNNKNEAIKFKATKIPKKKDDKKFTIEVF